MKSFHRCRRGMRSQLTGITIMKKIVNVTVGKSIASSRNGDPEPASLPLVGTHPAAGSSESSRLAIRPRLGDSGAGGGSADGWRAGGSAEREDHRDLDG